MERTQFPKMVAICHAGSRNFELEQRVKLGTEVCVVVLWVGCCSGQRNQGRSSAANAILSRSPPRRSGLWRAVQKSQVGGQRQTKPTRRLQLILRQPHTRPREPAFTFPVADDFLPALQFWW